MIRKKKNLRRPTTEDTLVRTLVPSSLPQSCVPVSRTVLANFEFNSGRGGRSGLNLTCDERAILDLSSSVLYFGSRISRLTFFSLIGINFGFAQFGPGELPSVLLTIWVSASQRGSYHG